MDGLVFGGQVTPPVNESSPAAQTTGGNEHTAPTDENIKIQRKLVLFTGLLVVVGFITAGAIIWQSWETRKAAQAAAGSVQAIEDQTGVLERQTALSERNLDLLIGRERPRIKVTVDDLVLFIDRGIQSVQYKIDCRCPIGVSIVKSSVDAYIEGVLGRIFGGIPIKDFDPPAGTAIIHQTTPVLESMIDDSFTDHVQAGNLHFRCLIEYRGIHLSDKEPPYITAVHCRWIVGPNVIPGHVDLVDHWEVCGPPEDNQQT